MCVPAILVARGQECPEDTVSSVRDRASLNSENIDILSILKEISPE